MQFLRPRVPPRVFPELRRGRQMMHRDTAPGLGQTCSMYAQACCNPLIFLGSTILSRWSGRSQVGVGDRAPRVQPDRSLRECIA